MQESAQSQPRARRRTRAAKPHSSSYLSPLLIGRSCGSKGGKGVFARLDVPDRSLLVVWGGHILTRDQARAGSGDERRLTVQVDDDAYLVSTVEGPADWVNHSCEPNSGMRGQITLVAMRDIIAGEEICFDYAMTDASDYDEFECGCGGKSCRGRVSGTDWMLPELMRRYEGFFSPYVSRRIASFDGQPLVRPRETGRSV